VLSISCFNATELNIFAVHLEKICKSSAQFYLVGLYVVEEILQYADERSCTNPEPDKQKNVIFPVVLSRCTIRAVYEDFRKPK